MGVNDNTQWNVDFFLIFMTSNTIQNPVLLEMSSLASFGSVVTRCCPAPVKQLQANSII